jgi:hypothetical protein
VSRRKNPLLWDTFAYEKIVYMCPVRDYGVGMTIDKAGQRPPDPVSECLLAHPDARPQNKWFSAEAGHQVCQRQSEFTVDTFQINTVIIAPQFQAEAQSDSCPSDLKPGKIFVLECATAHAVRFVPIGFFAG